MNGKRVDVVGVPWYARKDYARVRKMCRDGHKLSPTYDQWLKRANQTIQQLIDQGRLAFKAYISPQAFAAWCAERDLDVDANARARFASEVALRKYRETH